MTTKSLLSKLRLPAIKDRDEATGIAAGTAGLILARDKAALIRDERIEALKMEFALEIEEFDRKIDQNTKRLSAWAVANRKVEFGDKQSITLAGHKLSFRAGTGKVEFQPGVKEAEALDRILAQDDEATIERFVTIKTSLNKNAVISAWKQSATLRELLESCGIAVMKGESFTFEPDRDAVPDAAPVNLGQTAAV
jgi:phage host-nuclease inhibitor protein Gam